MDRRGPGHRRRTWSAHRRRRRNSDPERGRRLCGQVRIPGRHCRDSAGAVRGICAASLSSLAGRHCPSRRPCPEFGDDRHGDWACRRIGPTAPANRVTRRRPAPGRAGRVADDCGLDRPNRRGDSGRPATLRRRNAPNRGRPSLLKAIASGCPDHEVSTAAQCHFRDRGAARTAFSLHASSSSRQVPGVWPPWDTPNGHTT